DLEVALGVDQAAVGEVAVDLQVAVAIQEALAVPAVVAPRAALVLLGAVVVEVEDPRGRRRRDVGGAADPDPEVGLGEAERVPGAGIEAALVLAVVDRLALHGGRALLGDAARGPGSGKAARVHGRGPPLAHRHVAGGGVGPQGRVHAVVVAADVHV